MDGNSGVDGQAVIDRATWRIVPLIGLLYFLHYLDRINVGFAALTMNQDLGFSATIFGTGAGILFIGYVLCGIPSNLVLERVGARRWLACIIVVWGLLACATAFITGRLNFYVVRFFLGMAEAGFIPGAILYLTYWFPARTRAKLVAAFLMAGPLSTAVSAPVSTALLGLEGWGLKGWQWLFLIEGVPAIVLGFVVAFALADGPATARWLNEKEKAWLLGTLEEQSPSDNYVSSLSGAFFNGRLWVYGASYFGLLICFYGLNLWLPQIVKSLGSLTNLEVGFVSAIPYATAGVAMFLWGRHSDRTGERRWHMAAAAFAGAVGLAASGFLGAHPVAALAALTLASMGIYSSFAPFWTFPTALLRGSAAAGGIALINSIGNLGGYFGPSFVGAVKDATGSYSFALLALAGCITISGILALVMGRVSANEIRATGPVDIGG